MRAPNQAPYSLAVHPHATRTVTTFLAPRVWGAFAGSPSLGTFRGGRSNAWLLDASTDESVAASTLIPPWATSVHLYLWWANAGAGTGDIRVYLEWAHFGTGEDSNVADTQTPVAASGMLLTAAAQDVITRVLFDTLTVTRSELLFLKFRRNADIASDTLANDAAFLGLELVWN